MLEREITVEVVNTLNSEDEDEGEEHSPGDLWRTGDGSYKGYAPYVSDDFLGTYTARRWTWKEKQRATFNATQIVDQSKGVAEYNLLDLQMWRVIYCVEPPDGITLDEEFMNTADPDLGDILHKAAQHVNGFNLEEQNRFLGISDVEKDTPG